MAMDGSVRWSWTSYPYTRIEGSRMIIPLGCMYTPLQEPPPPPEGTETMPVVDVSVGPIDCGTCRGILNAHCAVDTRSKTWSCVLCGTSHTLPSNLSVGSGSIPPMLRQDLSTVEYALPPPKDRGTSAPPTFVLVIDTCVDDTEEFNALKRYAQVMLEMFPAHSRLALITFGAAVVVHDVGGAVDYPRGVVIRGNGDVSPASLRTQLSGWGVEGTFVVPTPTAEFAVSSLLDDLKMDRWPAPGREHRPLRCTGAAVATAGALLDLVSPKMASAIFLLTSGVCTEGPGCVVECSKATLIRTHVDLRDKTPSAVYWAPAVAHYEKLMRQFVHHGHSLNVVSASLDQTGLAEMRIAVQASGGLMLSVDSWQRPHLLDSLRKWLSIRSDPERGDRLDIAMNVTLDVVTSPTWKVTGAIGLCTGTRKTSSSVSETEVGLGGTCQWATSVLDRYTSFAFFFEPSAVDPSQGCRKDVRHVQFQTRYTVGTEHRLRVTTLAHLSVVNGPSVDWTAHFDPSTAAVLLARLAVTKMDGAGNPMDVLAWLDRTLIRWVARFARFTRGVESSVTLPDRMAPFPVFVYHLRRSAMLNVFNSSPDETAVGRTMMLKVPVVDGWRMIQPSLVSFAMQGGTGAVALESAAIRPDNILLLDTFFEVLVHWGEVVAAWKRDGYDEREDYAHFKSFLQTPSDLAQDLARRRFPTPRVMVVAKGAPDARILYHRLDPQRTHHSAPAPSAAGGDAAVIFTDELSLGSFMQHLRKVVVNQ